ncbi:hypothetical protein [Desulfosarcina widdelii]|uniref:hypothetical protein n=1 Tax=Desulfosarcina widdelii TaxID=947919 RepID=UPI0012D349D4|nr:hypothetical protein [Desulfosarcina widdelii]
MTKVAVSLFRKIEGNDDFKILHAVHPLKRRNRFGIADLIVPLAASSALAATAQSGYSAATAALNLRQTRQSPTLVTRKRL